MLELYLFNLHCILCPFVQAHEVLSIGKVASIQQNHKNIDSVKKGQAGGGAAVKIECPQLWNAKDGWETFHCTGWAVQQGK